MPFFPLVLGLMAFAFILDFVRVGAKSVWLDEAISVSYTREGLGQFWETVSHTDPNMALYYLLLRPWVGVFGESESAIRGLSGVFAALAVGAIALLGRRLFDRWTGIVAGLFLAMDAFFIQFAQTARAYTLVVLLVVLSSYFFVAELERPTGRNAVGYVVASTLAVYAHDFAAYVLLTELLTLIAVKRHDAVKRRWVAIGGSVIVLSIPELVFTSRAGTDNISWITQPSFGDLIDLPWLLVASRMIALTLIGLALYAIALRVRKGGTQVGGWQIGFASAWFAVPALAAFAVSFSLPMFRPYYLLVSASRTVAGGGCRARAPTQPLRDRASPPSARRRNGTRDPHVVRHWQQRGLSSSNPCH